MAIPTSQYHFCTSTMKKASVRLSPLGRPMTTWQMKTMCWRSLTVLRGAQPIASLSSIPDTCYGRLQSLSRWTLGSKHFWHFIPFDTSVCSFVLCNRSETSLKELMRTCKAAEHVLHLTLKDPFVLLGGGCTEVHLAAVLRYKSANMQSHCLNELNCTAAEYQLVSDSFCLSLESVARNLEHDRGERLLDLQEGHCWSASSDGALDFQCSATGQQCGCGMYSRDDSFKWNVLGSRYEPFSPRKSTQTHSPTRMDKLVLDCFTAKWNGMQVAVNTAALILDLSYVVEDQN